MTRPMRDFLNASLPSYDPSYTLVGLELVMMEQAATQQVVWSMPLSKPFVLYRTPVLYSINPKLIRYGYGNESITISKNPSSPISFIDVNDMLYRGMKGFEPKGAVANILVITSWQSFSSVSILRDSITLYNANQIRSG